MEPLKNAEHNIEPIKLQDIRLRDEFIKLYDIRRNYKSTQEYRDKNESKRVIFLKRHRNEIEIRISSFLNDDNKEVVQDLPLKVDTQGVDVSDIIQQLTIKGYTCEINNDDLIIS